MVMLAIARGTIQTASTDDNFEDEWRTFEEDLRASEPEDQEASESFGIYAKAKAKSNQYHNKAGKGWVSPEDMQDLAALLDEDQPKGKGGGNRKYPTRARMDDINLAGHGDLLKHFLLPRNPRYEPDHWWSDLS